MKVKKLSAALLSAVMTASMWSGTVPVVQQAITAEAASTSPMVEYLDRGISAVNTGSGMLVSWRWTMSDSDSAVFKLYRDGTLIYTSEGNASTCYLDKGGTASSKYRVDTYAGTKLTDSAECKLTSNGNYFDINLSQPGSGYTPNDMSVGDVDGDGQYELFLKWDPSNSKDNSQKGKTDPVYIDCYTLEGKRLWRINLGYNIRAGAHYTQFYVGDFDLDGKCEMTCKTADGTVDGKGVTIGDGSKVYRNSNGYILTGNEYYTLFDGETGAALDTVNYKPARGTVSSWGDSYGNRVDRFWGTVAYLDGVHPCIVTGRGYYTRMTATAYKVENKKLVEMWAFDTGNSSSTAGYGDGNHNSMPADVDGDGKQEIITGATCIDDNGTVKWWTNQGHGDAMHVGDLDPTNSGQEAWICHEEKVSGYGVSLIDCNTGKLLYHQNGAGDTGRCCADNVWAENPGAECWGNKLSDNSMPVVDTKGNVLSCRRPAINFLSYWDGDLEREILDGYTDSPATITKMNSKGTLDTIFTTDGYYTCNTTKGTPCLSADIFGDWREELICRAADGKSIRIFTTTYDSDYRITTLMHDPQYRMQVSSQQTAYNQPPHVSWFMGTGYDLPKRPECTVNGEGGSFGKPGAAIDTSEKYIIRNVNSGLSLEIADGAVANGTNVQQGTSDQSWILESAGGGYYYVYTSLDSDKSRCLDLEYGNPDNGTNVGIWANDNSDARMFKFVDNGDGTYTICTKATGDESCLGVLAASKDAGANVLQWACNDSNDQKWTLEIKVDPFDGNLVKQLLVKDVSTHNDWTIDTSMVIGDAVFGDRDFTYTELPAVLLGSESILTACNSKNYDAQLAEFEAGEAMTVYVALDSRQTAVPAWLGEYTNTGLTAKSSNDVTFNIYSKTAAKGEKVTLGTNGGSVNLVNYSVFVKPQAIAGNAAVSSLLINDCENFYDWSVQDSADIGSTLYGDRDFTFTQMSDELKGLAAVRTACDSKNLDTDLAVITAGADETVYVLVDARVTASPAWLAGFEKTDLSAASSNDVSYVVYSKKVSKGDEILLGTNGQSSGCVNYTVLVDAGAAAVTTTTAVATTVTTTTVTEAETTTTTSEAAATTEGQVTTTATASTSAEAETTTTAVTTSVPADLPEPNLYGDATNDGNVQLNDAVLIMQAIANPNKYGLDGTDELHITPQGWSNADCCKPGDGVTPKDALSIQRVLLQLIDALPTNE